MGYITRKGFYYEGDRHYSYVNGEFVLDREVIRPNSMMIWVDNKWKIDLEVLRLRRDMALELTDKYAISDYMFDNKEEVILFRQKLRDLPKDIDIENPIFPGIPANIGIPEDFWE